MRRVLLSAFLLCSAPPAWALRAAAGKADVTPDASRRVYLAGYGAGGRRAKGVHDPLHARAVLLESGDSRVALVAVDSIGLYREDVLDLRRRTGYEGKEGRYLFVAATHDHSAPDTMGLWGPLAGVSGVDPAYQESIKSKVAALLRELEGRLEPVSLSLARVELDPKGLCKDTRDPVVIDPELGALQLKKSDGKALATLVRWSCHPEVLGSENDLVTADFPGALCARVEDRTKGACVYLSGAIGGLLAPEVDRAPGVEHQFREARRIGEAVADRALAALAKSAAVAGARLAYGSKTVRVPVENSRYLVFLPNLTFGHAIFDATGAPLPKRRAYALALRHLAFFPLPERARPWVETEVSRVDIGPLRILGMPGELFPELAIGGYDGSRRYGHPLTRPDNPNPPDLSRAPKGPYLRERLGAHGWVVGLANDELGYIVPAYDFQAAPNRAMAPRPPGTHYEETNSIGPRAAAILLEAAAEVLR